MSTIDWKARAEAAEAERDEWRTKALDVEKHPVVVALLAERDALRAKFENYAEMAQYRWGLVKGDAPFPGGGLAAYDTLLCEANADRDALADQNAALRAALEKIEQYGLSGHDENCRWDCVNDTYCSCGYDDAVHSMRSALALTPPAALDDLRRREREAALREAATKGEWTVLVDEHETDSGGTVIAGEIAIPEINRMMHSTEWAESTDWQRDLDNAEFIAAANNALPALLDELEAEREEVRRLREIVTAPTYREALALLAGKDARDRRMKAIGAAEELERLAKVNQHRMLDCDDLMERAAQLRQEAADGQ